MSLEAFTSESMICQCSVPKLKSPIFSYHLQDFNLCGKRRIVLPQKANKKSTSYDILIVLQSYVGKRSKYLKRLLRNEAFIVDTVSWQGSGCVVRCEEQNLCNVWLFLWDSILEDSMVPSLMYAYLMNETTGNRLQLAIPADAVHGDWVGL